MTRRLPTGRAGQALAVALLGLLLMACWTAVAAPLLDWHAERAEALAQRTTLARRMMQVAASLPALQAQAGSAPGSTAGSGPAPVAVIDGASDAVAGAALQQLVQAMAARAGTTIASTEALPGEQVGALRLIGVRIAIRAPWPALIMVLRMIDEATPQMLVDDLQVHGQRGYIRDGAAPLDASMVVMAFRAGGPQP